MLTLLNDLFAWWGIHWGPLRLFDYVTTRLVAALVTAFVLMLVIMPPLIRWLKKKKFGETGAKNQGAAVVDAMREGKKGTPTMGGLGLVVCIALTALLWCDPLAPRTWLLVFGLLAFAVLGFLDDRTKIFKGAKGTPLFVKLGIQIGAALSCGVVLWLIDGHYAATLNPTGGVNYIKELPGGDFIVTLGTYTVALPFIGMHNAIYLGVFSVVWTMFVTIACANGVNFTDGMDGLASGTMVISALAFGVIAYLVGRVDSAEYLKVFYVPGGQDVAIFCAAMVGACLGFLWFNCNPAEVFMGDTGSQALGGALGLVALNTKQEFLVLLVGAIFVMEALSVALQIASFRLRGGKRIFLCAPIHHHFQMKGWSETKIVIRFWIIAAGCALLAIATLKLG